MKRFTIMILCLFMAVALAGCGAGGSNGEQSGSAGAQEKPVKMLEKICKNVEVPASDYFALDKDNFKEYAFVAWKKGLEAACAEGKINTDTHSLVLIRTEAGESEALAKSIAQKADVRKWVCVEAEVGNVLYNDRYVLMIMSYKNSYEALKDNFEKTTGATAKVIEIQSAKGSKKTR